MPSSHTHQTTYRHGSGAIRHKRLLVKAFFIDDFVVDYKRVRKRKSFPHKEVGMIIRFLFSGASYKGRGAFKTVHRVHSMARDLVLKTSNAKNIRADIRAYSRLPASIRNRYFAKIYWATRHMLLQKYGRAAERVPDDVLRRLKAVGKEHRLTDIRPANIRKVEGKYKIVDASVSHKRKRRK